MPVRTPSSDQLPLRWAMILLLAVFTALLIGGLTFAQTASWPAALLAAAAAAGATIPAAHQILAHR
jgi:hypothetical protein